MKCPKCGKEVKCDMVDVGPGEIPCGPYMCRIDEGGCGWVEDQDEYTKMLKPGWDKQD